VKRNNINGVVVQERARGNTKAGFGVVDVTRSEQFDVGKYQLAYFWVTRRMNGTIIADTAKQTAMTR
jgi:hypothetical protein